MCHYIVTTDKSAARENLCQQPYDANKHPHKLNTLSLDLMMVTTGAFQKGVPRLHWVEGKKYEAVYILLLEHRNG